MAETAAAGFLQKKMEEASRSAARKLESELLWGNSTGTYRADTPVTLDEINKTALDGYKKSIANNVYSSSQWIEEVLKKAKENTMSDTHAAVAKARAEAKEAKAAQLLDHIESEIGQYELVPGTFLTARVEFDTSDKVYRYGWIRSDNSWYRTYSTKVYSTDDLVDELVQLILDATSVEWEIVGVER